MLGAPLMLGAPMGTYNNYGTGGAGSYNFGNAAQPQPVQPQPVKPQPAQTAQYNNHGSGGAGSSNMPARRKRAVPMAQRKMSPYL